MSRALAIRLGLLAGLLFSFVVVLGQEQARACKPCGDCEYDFSACVGDCPQVDGSPEQSCYTACSNARNHCYTFCCMTDPGGGGGGGGCPPSCPYNCDASGHCF
jgi:hypothetical protein